MSRQFATQRDPDWANDFDPAAHQNGPGPGPAGVFDEDFIDQVDPEFLGEPLQLYNLKTDVGENDDVAAKNPEVVARLEAIMKSARTDSERWVPKKGKK